MKQKNRFANRLLAASIASMVPAASTAASDSLAEAISGGKPGLALRYRYEQVDQDSLEKKAEASVLRLRLNYQTASWQSLSAFAEFDHVLEVGADNFNSGAGTSSADRAQYPVVADPNGSDLNQLYIDYAANKNLKFRLGRQRILLDNQRFVGGVGWRQNEQTYDALALLYNQDNRFKLHYSYIANVNRIFGDSVAAGDHNNDTHLINAAININKKVSVGAYGYLIDNEDAAAFSTNTFGLKFSVSQPSSYGLWKLDAEYARQKDGSGAPVDFDADYFRAELGLKLENSLSFGAGIESLGGDESQAGKSFRTPLATLHAFNGWADQFLATPAQGLDDTFVKASWGDSKWKLSLVWHDFSAESGSQDFGTELDLAANYAFSKRYKGTLKLASFDGEEPGRRDVNKIWLMFSASY